MGITNWPARTKVFNRYISKRFGFSHKVNEQIARSLLGGGSPLVKAVRSNSQLEACLQKLGEQVGRRVQLDARGVLQWQPGN